MGLLSRFFGSNESKPSAVDQLKEGGMAAFVDMSDDEKVEVYTWAQEVARRYGSILGKASSNIEDKKCLPYPKEEIRTALHFLIVTNRLYNDPKKKHYLESLRAVYILLSNFVDIEADHIDLIDSVNHRMSSLKETTDEEKRKKAIIKFAKDFKVYYRYIEKQKQELLELQQDLLEIDETYKPRSNPST